jgi:phage tail-like protein
VATARNARVKLAVSAATVIAVLAVILYGPARQSQANAGAGLPPSRPNDALTAARFSLTIDGVEIASFSELQGITSEVEPIEFLEGDETRLGKLKPPTVVLKRGKNQGLELWAWHEAVRSGDIAAARKSVSLVMYNTQDKPVAHYHLENAWPSKLEIGGLNARGSEVVLTETVTIVAERIQRLQP